MNELKTKTPIVSSAGLEPAKDIKVVKFIARCITWGALLIILLAGAHLNKWGMLVVAFVGGYGAGSLSIISTYRERF